MLKIFTIPALKDNYISILRNDEGQTAVIDPSEAAPVIQFLEEKNWTLAVILNTHHHFDHTGGNEELKKKYKADVMGFEKDASRIPGISIKLKENEIWQWGEHPCRILPIPGHTSGHIAFSFFKDLVLFSGDTLFSMGCGRIFEGTFEQMFSSLNKLASLDGQTRIYCGHEYTEANGRFALEVESENLKLKKRMKEVLEKRKKGLSTMPFFLLDELETNPFLRCGVFSKEKERITHPKLKQDLQKKAASPLEIFTELRRLKDHF